MLFIAQIFCAAMSMNSIQFHQNYNNKLTNYQQNILKDRMQCIENYMQDWKEEVGTEHPLERKLTNTYKTYQSNSVSEIYKINLYYILEELHKMFFENEDNHEVLCTPQNQFSSGPELINKKNTRTVQINLKSTKKENQNNKNIYITNINLYGETKNNPFGKHRRNQTMTDSSQNDKNSSQFYFRTPEKYQINQKKNFYPKKSEYSIDRPAKKKTNDCLFERESVNLFNHYFKNNPQEGSDSKNQSPQVAGILRNVINSDEFNNLLLLRNSLENFKGLLPHDNGLEQEILNEWNAIYESIKCKEHDLKTLDDIHDIGQKIHKEFSDKKLPSNVLEVLQHQINNVFAVEQLRILNTFTHSFF